MASGHKCPNERGLVSVFGQVKEVWPLQQFRRRRCGFCVNRSKGGVASASVLMKVEWSLLQSQRGVASVPKSSSKGGVASELQNLSIEGMSIVIGFECFIVICCGGLYIFVVPCYVYSIKASLTDPYS